ncbi:MAG: cyclase family protein [Burkholderiales bacterium]
MIIDLSHPLEAGMPSYPGLPVPRFKTFLSHRDTPQHAQYAEGVSFQIASYEFGANTGTYVDAPFHRHPDGADLLHLPLEKLANVPGILVRVNNDGPIGPDHFRNLDVDAKAVLIRTDWSKRWRRDYFMSGPYLTADACDVLVQAGATVVGIDCANIDNMKDPERPAHTILLGAGIPIVEHLRSLDKLTSKRFRFFDAHPAIEGGTSITVRAFAVVDAL